MVLMWVGVALWPVLCAYLVWHLRRYKKAGTRTPLFCVIAAASLFCMFWGVSHQ